MQGVLTDIPQAERQSLGDCHVSISLGFFSLPLALGPYDRGLPK